MAQAAAALSPVRSNARLRELGVYTLPDGGEYVVSTLYSDGCGLYSKRSWETYREAEYRVDSYGRVVSRGAPTGWRVEDLEDTGRTTTYPQPIIG